MYSHKKLLSPIQVQNKFSNEYSFLIKFDCAFPHSIILLILTFMADLVPQLLQILNMVSKRNHSAETFQLEPVAKCEGKFAGIYSTVCIYMFLNRDIFSKSKGRNKNCRLRANYY
jgi:hypothetical protein